jgi:hypothetical protein
VNSEVVFLSKLLITLKTIIVFLQKNANAIAYLRQDRRGSSTKNTVKVWLFLFVFAGMQRQVLLCWKGM